MGPVPRNRISWCRDTRVPDTIRPAAGLSLGPGQVMRIWIPMRLNGTCYETGSWPEVGTGRGPDLSHQALSGQRTTTIAASPQCPGS
jgi:hypothetical protein